MVKYALLKHLKNKKTSAQIVIKIHQMIEKVKAEKEKELKKEKGKKDEIQDGL